MFASIIACETITITIHVLGVFFSAPADDMPVSQRPTVAVSDGASLGTDKSHQPAIDSQTTHARITRNDTVVDGTYHPRGVSNDRQVFRGGTGWEINNGLQRV